MIPLVFALAALAGATLARAQETPVPGHRVDHLVVAISDLERGREELAQRTGIMPIDGGEHPGLGTHNALMSLGRGVYLEVLAPQPGAELEPRMAGLQGLEQLTPVLWAVSTRDLEATRGLLAEAGFATTEAEPGARVTPHGSRLEWATFALAEPVPGAPFFIRWTPETPHPSGSAPGGCALASLTVATPAAGRMRELLAALAVEVAVVEATEADLEIVLACPNGEVQL